MGVDVAAYWTPGTGFFERLTKGHMEEIAKEVIDTSYAQAHQKNKKGVFAEAMGNAFDPEVKSPSVNKIAAKRLAAWVPDCMTVAPAEPVKADKQAA